MCEDEQGRKTVQDQPCPEAAPVRTEQARKKPAETSGPGIEAIAIGIALLLAGVAAVALLRHRMAKARDTATSEPDRIEFEADSTFSIPAAESSGREWSLGLIRELEWLRFEELCCEIWKSRGYQAEMTSMGEDGGVDVVVRDDDGSVAVVMQCKSWTTSQVGVESVRALWGAKDHFKAGRAVFYGLSGFSEAAQRFAQDKALDLYSGQELLEQLRALPVAIQGSILDHVTRGDYVTPSCPKCGTKMVRRAVEGREMWGCASFPRCRGPMIPVR